jgi:hypothetical protein
MPSSLETPCSSDVKRQFPATKDIWMMGCGGLIASFLDENKIDEFIIHLDSRIKACLDADGGAAEGASLPAQPFMWIDVYHQPATDAQLAIHKITRKEWEKYHQARIKATEGRLEACSACYRITIKVPGTDHYSFTDSPLLDAEKKEDFNAALRALQPIEAYVAAFFDKQLKHQAGPLLDQSNTAPGGITLEKYGKAR